MRRIVWSLRRGFGCRRPDWKSAGKHARSIGDELVMEAERKWLVEWCGLGEDVKHVNSRQSGNVK